MDGFWDIGEVIIFPTICKGFVSILVFNTSNEISVIRFPYINGPYPKPTAT